MYVLWIIGIWKILGAITLSVPGFLRLKEWAYAGIVFELSGAVASLAACGRNADLIAPLFLLSLALASWALRPANRTLGKPLIAQFISISLIDPANQAGFVPNRRRNDASLC